MKEKNKYTLHTNAKTFDDLRKRRCMHLFDDLDCKSDFGLSEEEIANRKEERKKVEDHLGLTDLLNHRKQ